jgi:hypothetical protein
MINSTPRHVCSFLIPASGTASNATNHQTESPSVEKSFIRRCNSSRASLNSSSNVSRNSSLSQIQQDSQSSVSQSVGLKRNNSFNSTTTSSSTISTSAPTSSTNNSPTKSFRQLGSLAIPINSQRSSPLHVAFHQYLLAPTSDGRLLIYQVCDFDHAERIILEEELSYSSSSSSVTLNATKPLSDIHKLSSQAYQEKHTQMPMGIIGPLHVGEYRNIPLGLSESTTSSMKDNSPPVSIVELTSIHANDTSVSSLLGYVALITLQGDVFVFEFHKSDQERSLQIQFFCGFGCGRISAQCIALRYHQTKLFLACGFADGTIQEFEVEKNIKSLCWEGYLNHRPIACLAYITDLVQDKENAIENDPTSLSQLIVGMSQCEPQPTGRSKPEDIIATCLEVVSVDIAKSMWDQKMIDSASMLPSSISLIESTVWPTNEWNHIFENPRNHHLHSLERVESKKVSHELHSIHSVQVSHSSFTIAMSNGAVATLNFWINDRGKFCWGMANVENQCILSSPTCGLGMLNNHIATCSRDASVIMIPNQTENKLEPLKSPVLLSIPFESIGFDEDDLVRYVQGFCACEIQAKIWGSSREHEPNLKKVQALFVAWPGGCIECYSFEYLSRDVLKEETLAVMKRLSEDGILHDLISLFQSYLNHPSYDGDSLLGRAAKEYQQWEGDDNELILSLMNQSMDSSSIVQFLFARITEI